MSERLPLARIATDLLATEVPEDRTREAYRHRAANIDAIAATIRDRARGRARRRAAAVLLVAAAAAFATLGLGRYLHGINASKTARSSASAQPFATLVETPGPVDIVRGPNRSIAFAGAPLAAGDAIDTGIGGSAAMELSTGTKIWVEATSRLAVIATDTTQVLELDRGGARFAVAKLHAGHRFLVRTSDAEVEVRGTQFRVVAGDDATCPGIHTRVEVTEGTVDVRSASGLVRVPAGSVFPTCPRVSTASATTVTARRVPPRAVPKAEPEVRSSELAAQNDAFAEAMEMKRRGDSDGAARAFASILARWPSSPLAENAEVERMRALRGEAAVEAARTYLGRWPNGYARSEANHILGKAGHASVVTDASARP